MATTVVLQSEEGAGVVLTRFSWGQGRDGGGKGEGALRQLCCLGGIAAPWSVSCPLGFFFLPHGKIRSCLIESTHATLTGSLEESFFPQSFHPWLSALTEVWG